MPGSRNGHAAHAASTWRREGGRSSEHAPDGTGDRSYLLRRRARSPIANGNGSDSLRLRRSRRVCASFSAIPDLAREPTA
jgi:hypothetical protein